MNYGKILIGASGVIGTIEQGLSSWGVWLVAAAFLGLAIVGLKEE